MNLDGIIGSIKKNASRTLRAGAMLGVLSGAPAGAQELPSKPEHQQEKTEPEVIPTIPLPERYFKIDDFVAATEGTEEERRALAEELFAHVLQHGTPDKDTNSIKGMVFPLELSGEKLEVYVMIISGEHKEVRIVVRVPGDKLGESVQIHDEAITGTPSWNMLPVDEKGKLRPQGFALEGTSPLANRVYLGILRQLMNKY